MLCDRLKCKANETERGLAMAMMVGFRAAARCASVLSHTNTRVGLYPTALNRALGVTRVSEQLAYQIAFLIPMIQSFVL